MTIDFEKVRQALEQFNHLRAPKITAKLISIKGNRVTVDFDGFLLIDVCCIADWFDDLRFEMESLLGRRVQVKSIEVLSPVKHRVVYEAEL